MQRCDFGFRKIVFLAVGRSLAIRYSDSGGAPDPLVDVFDLLPDETPDDGVKRVFGARTKKAFAGRCVMQASKSRKFLFVRVGQDEPLFDEQNFRLLPGR